MRTITYNFANSRFPLYSEPLAWRIGYLVADELAVACVPAGSLYFMEWVTKVKDAKARLDLLKRYFKNPTHELHKNVDQLIEHYKEFKKMKHKTKEFLVLSRQLEKLISQFYEVFLKCIENELTKMGLIDLKDLLDVETFGFHQLDPFNAEDTSQDNLSASQILMRIGQRDADEEGPEIFMLTPEFFKEDDQQNIYDATDLKAETHSNGYLHKCFEMPFLLDLSNPELKMVRKELKGTMEQFKKAVDAWIEYSLTNTAGSIYYFRENVMKLAADAHEAICQNDMLAEKESAYEEKFSTEVWIGELPITRIWDYYKKMEAIPSDTWKILEKARLKDSTYQKRFPVIVLKDKLDNNESLLDEVTSLTTKKSILID